MVLFSRLLLHLVPSPLRPLPALSPPARFPLLQKSPLPLSAPKPGGEGGSKVPSSRLSSISESCELTFSPEVGGRLESSISLPLSYSRSVPGRASVAAVSADLCSAFLDSSGTLPSSPIANDEDAAGFPLSVTLVDAIAAFELSWTDGSARSASGPTPVATTSAARVDAAMLEGVPLMRGGCDTVRAPGPQPGWGQAETPPLADVFKGTGRRQGVGRFVSISRKLSF